MKFIFIRDKIITPKLVDMLGHKMAEDISKRARSSATTAREEKEQLKLYVEKTCSDPRFIGMWGTAQAQKQKQEWLDLMT